MVEFLVTIRLQCYNKEGLRFWGKITMGEAMGPNTVAALHLGADHMIEQLEAREAPNERNTAILSTSPPITAGGEVGLDAKETN